MKLLKTGPIIRCTHGKSNATIHSSCFLCLFEKCVQEALNSVKLLPWVGRKKGSQPKTVTWISTQCPLICHESIAQHRHNLQKFLLFFFLVHYKLLLLMLFFVVILRNNLVAFGIVLPRILLHAFSSTNNLAGSGNSSLCNFVLCTFFFFLLLQETG